jgi:hypothetical protein
MSSFYVKYFKIYVIVKSFEVFLTLKGLNSHVPMIYYEPYYIKQSYIFNTKLNYHF